ncbi:DUF1302 domain-containing protein [Noviherbaspirillum sp.]|uniref:DUF1302 domain-containing protein n=1 Tax=Noviherbaspirillum sp. TaxID=1926288 RepID=UPI002FE15A56
MKIRSGRLEVKWPWFIALALAGTGLAPAAQAFEIDTGSDVKVRWDNTVKYSAARRLSGQSPGSLSNINADDGNRNFDTGLISNRLDLLSELDVIYQGMGLRVSGAAWYDKLYNRANDNDSPSTANAFTVPYNEFTDATSKLHGKRAELLDAFVFGNGRIGDMHASLRAGKHTLLWGESLMLATNGISYGQAPLDIIKAQSVPGSQAKELFMPVGQISGQLQPSPELSFAAYFQYDWRKSRLPAAGSYFSSADILDAGGERLLLSPQPGPALLRGPDTKARNSGQGGVSARYYAKALDTEFGLYYLRFNDKLPQVYARPGEGSYALVYPEDIRVLGASFSTVVGASNVAGEIHMRRNMPLASVPLALPPGSPADNRHNPLYAVGNTVHAQVSIVHPLHPTAVWDSGTIVAEVGGLYRTSVTRNAGNLDPGTDRGALGFSVRFTPSYFQVLPELDLSVPVSLGYNIRGKTPVTSAFNGDKAGTFSIGLIAEYQKAWYAALLYTNYFGGMAAQPLKDRDFISFAIQRTF